MTNPGYSCSTTLVHLITTDTNKVKLYWPIVAAYSIPTLASGSFIYFVAQEEELTINSSSNKVTVQNAAAGAVTFYSVSLSSPNNYDPVTHTFNVKFGYSYGVPGVFDVGCKEWMQTLTYVGHGNPAHHYSYLPPPDPFHSGWLHTRQFLNFKI